MQKSHWMILTRFVGLITQVATYLESLEKLQNSKVVREKSLNLFHYAVNTPMTHQLSVVIYTVYFVSSWCHLMCHSAAATATMH